jgi:hypothetical protein
MKVYWCEHQISNADNFEDMYTDANIKTYSRANAVDKNLKLLAEYRKYARDLETRYGRVTADRKPSLGDVNDYFSTFPSAQSKKNSSQPKFEFELYF